MSFAVCARDDADHQRAEQRAVEIPADLREQPKALYPARARRQVGPDSLSELQIHAHAHTVHHVRVDAYELRQVEGVADIARNLALEVARKQARAERVRLNRLALLTHCVSGARRENRYDRAGQYG